MGGGERDDVTILAIEFDGKRASVTTSKKAV